MKNLFLPLVLVALAFPAAAQTRPAAPPHQNYRIDKVQRAQRTQLSDKKSFRLTYTPVPDPIPLNQHFRVRLQLQDAQNRILSGATLKVEATMPEHNHGMNVKPTVKSLGKGLYEVRGLLFHMPGYWEMMATVSHQGKTEKVIFGVTVVNKATAPIDHSGHAGH